MEAKFIQFWKELMQIALSQNFFLFQPYVELLHRYVESHCTFFLRKMDRVTVKVVSSIPEKIDFELEEDDFELIEDKTQIKIFQKNLINPNENSSLVFLPINTEEITGAFVVEIPNQRISEHYLDFLQNIKLALQARFRFNSFHEAIQKKAHQFHVIMETLPQAVIYFEENGSYVWLNSVARNLLGLEKDITKPEVVSFAMTQFRNKANNQKEIIEKAMDFFKSGAQSSEDWFWTFGNPVNLVYKVKVLKTSYQNTHGQIWVLENVTQSYLDNLEIKRLNEEIQKKILIAENANNAKSIFLANMSHELRTPLNSILGFSQILLQSPEIKKAEKEHIQFIYKSGEHLLNLINDILDLSKVEAGKYELYYTNFSLPSLILTISKMIEIKALEKGLRYEVDQSPNLPKIIQFDEQKLKQVLLNLLSNAVKYTDKGEVILSVHLLEKKGNKNRILFVVKDTGRGIPEKHIQDIFLPFEQLNSGNTYIQGTGLGLAITKSFVELMGSEIKVISKEGEGSTFSFEIEVEEEQGFLEEELGIGEVVGYRGRRLKVLIVDDILLNRILLDEILVNLGFETRLASSGEEAIQILETYNPDLIFMDLKMRGMSGFEAITHIKHHPELDKIKIIATSASAFNETRNKCLAAGADEFITKPIQRHELLSKITFCLKPNWIFKEKDNLQEQKNESDLKEALELGLIQKLLDAARKGDVAELENLVTHFKEQFPEQSSLWEIYEKYINNFEINLLVEKLNLILREQHELT